MYVCMNIYEGARFSESPKRFGNHRKGKLKSYHRIFVIRFICITYLEGLQCLIVFISVYILQCVGVIRAEFS
jgi:hypothetical protein